MRLPEMAFETIKNFENKFLLLKIKYFNLKKLQTSGGCDEGRWRGAET
jgi:hypothetical protein